MKSGHRAFAQITTPQRPDKPREQGLSMVLDKNLGHSGLTDLLETAADAIDIVKFGWGSSATQDRALIQAKCALLSRHEVLVCPGGTLTELAWFQGRIDWYLDEAQELGFSCIEVSDGTVPMPHAEKLRIIELAKSSGFRVLSEVGSKVAEEDRRITLESRVDQIETELDAGAWKVIIEARESGTQGIFDSSGAAQLDLLHHLVAMTNVENIIFEAPLRHQQVDLILSLGQNVNLGNISPSEAVNVETLRRGLRSDTLRHYQLGYPSLMIGVGVNAAHAAARRGDVIVVIDALRASSTIVTALASGMRAVRPVLSVEECVGEVTAGERGGRKVAHLQFDNSPLAFTSPVMVGKELVLTTSNGTECLGAAASNPDAVVLVGALLNATAVGKRAMDLARARSKNITLVCAGRNNQMAVEDLIAASEIAMAITGAPIVGDIKPISCKDFYEGFLTSESGRNLSSLGKTDEVLFCARKDAYSVSPLYEHGMVSISHDS